ILDPESHGRFPLFTPARFLLQLARSPTARTASAPCPSRHVAARLRDVPVRRLVAAAFGERDLLPDRRVLHGHGTRPNSLGEFLPTEQKRVPDLLHLHLASVQRLPDDGHPAAPFCPALVRDATEIVYAFVGCELEREVMRKAVEPLLTRDQCLPRPLRIQGMQDCV